MHQTQKSIAVSEVSHCPRASAYRCFLSCSLTQPHNETPTLCLANCQLPTNPDETKEQNMAPSQNSWGFGTVHKFDDSHQRYFFQRYFVLKLITQLSIIPVVRFILYFRFLHLCGIWNELFVSFLAIFLQLFSQSCQPTNLKPGEKMKALIGAFRKLLLLENLSNWL